MSSNKEYYKKLELDLLNHQNIEEKNTIHGFEDKTLELNADKLKWKYTMNEIR